MRLLFFVCLALLGAVETAKILAIFPFPGRSQYIFAESYLKNLAERGHLVTVITTLPSKPVDNMSFIVAPAIHKHFDAMVTDMQSSTLWGQLNGFKRILITITQCTLDDEGVRQLVESGEQFDLVIAEAVQTEVLFGLAQHFNATLMGVSSYGSDTHIDGMMGNISPVSYNPLVISARIDRMTFYERLENLYDVLMVAIHRQWVHLPAMESLYKEYFPQATQTLPEVMDSFALMLLGQHFTLSHARPYLPNMIEVGGLHISHQPAPLPEDIREFIETASEGVIYFSMGSNVKSKDLPPSTLQLLLKVFGSLKQRVLWKFEEQHLPGKPANVLISKWFPQSDILAHPQVKLFITHGGLLSTIESVYHGKPVLGLPVFYDQFMNVKRASRMGFGLGLDLNNLEEQELQQTIHTLLTTPSYTQASATISRRYRDQKEPPMERAIWWTEYVLRHKDAGHLRAASRDLSFLQLYSMDTLAVLIGVPLLVLWWLLRLSGGKQSRRQHKHKRH